ncbi:MAG: metallopeptidase TldD-related protein [Thiotrichales bacterium]
MTPERLAELTRTLSGGLRHEQRLTLNYSGETSDFARFNHNRVRQSGQVVQHYLTLELVAGTRHLSASTSLTDDADDDTALSRALLIQLQERLAHTPADPYLNLPATASHSETMRRGALPEPAQVLHELAHAAAGLDLVGLYAGGEIARGMADSLGSLHWHASESFNFDWSCHLDDARAVKNAYAGFAWDPEVLTTKLAHDRETLRQLERPLITLNPGSYRAFLSPTALQELLDMLGWGDLGCKSQRTRQSALLQLIDGAQAFNASVTLMENHARGLAPCFTRQGFMTAQPVTLIEQGQHRDALVGPRSAKEYALAVNSPAEAPAALEMAPGSLASADALAALDTGLYVSNLWYCNYSDRNHGRITGMTRFATLWVEAGQIRGPVAVMRFDDTLYRMLGEHLLDLTVERELLLDPGTYGGRSTASALLPGALLGALELTL